MRLCQRMKQIRKPDPHRVNRAHWPTKENTQNLIIFFFWFFWSMEKMASDGPKWGQEDFCLTNPDLADIWAERIWILRGLIFLIYGPQLSGFPGPQISKFPDFQVPRSSNSQISKFPDFHVPRPSAPGRTLRSHPDHSPNAPRDQIHRKEPSLRWTDQFDEVLLAFGGPMSSCPKPFEPCFHMETRLHW